MHYFVFQKFSPLFPVVDIGREENPFKDQRVKVEEGGIHGSLHLLLIASMLEEVERFVESLQGEVIIIHGSVITRPTNDFIQIKTAIASNQAIT